MASVDPSSSGATGSITLYENGIFLLCKIVEKRLQPLTIIVADKAFGKTLEVAS